MKICSAKFDYLAWSDPNSNSPEPPRYVVDLIYNAMDVPIPPIPLSNTRAMLRSLASPGPREPLTRGGLEPNLLINLHQILSTHLRSWRG
jgi:hypothetical protein